MSPRYRMCPECHARVTGPTPPCGHDVAWDAPTARCLGCGGETHRVGGHDVCAGCVANYGKMMGGQ